MIMLNQSHVSYYVCKCKIVRLHSYTTAQCVCRFFNFNTCLMSISKQNSWNLNEILASLMSTKDENWCLYIQSFRLKSNVIGHVAYWPQNHRPFCPKSPEILGRNIFHHIIGISHINVLCRIKC